MKITPSTGAVKFNLSEYLNLTCIVDSYPLEYPKWKRNDIGSIQKYSEVKSNEKSFAYISFIISSLQRSDNGTYSCCVQQEPEFCQSVDVIVQSKK